jgi:hypothetical protein
MFLSDSIPIVAGFMPFSPQTSQIKCSSRNSNMLMNKTLVGTTAKPRLE